MTLPPVLSEFETINQALKGKSLARYGDGELRLMAGRGTCVSQDPDPKLAAELRDILKNPPKNCLVCLPISKGSPKAEMWARYQGHDFLKHFGAGPYGSAFISRPDSAPWIDTPEYWHSVCRLWEGKHVVFAAGSDRSLRADDFSAAAALTHIEAPRRDAYSEIDRLELEITVTVRDGGVAILCLGPTATVLAARLSRKGIHALDLGHIGMFMRRQGLYAKNLDDIASPAYREQLRLKHASVKWGKSGHSHVDEVRAWAQELGAVDVLDYGCGRGTLKPALAPMKCYEFDPGIDGKEHLPKPAGVIACTDVLEHIEGDRLDVVLEHIYKLAVQGAYFVISCRPAREILADGRNAHLSIHEPEWWLKKLKKTGWKIRRHDIRKGLCVWAAK